MRTTRPGTDAAGGVTGLDQFVYMAAHGAKIAARNALNGDALAYDNRVMPAVVFTDPQVASVGWTKASAREAGYEVKTSVLRSEERRVGKGGVSKGKSRWHADRYKKN